MNYQRYTRSFLLIIVLISLVLLSACSHTYGDDHYTFSAPAGFATKKFDSQIDSHRNAEYLLYSYKGHLYFQIFRQVIAQNSDLNTLSAAYISKTKDEVTHFQLISQNTIEINDRPAIEYVYRLFHGEPYVQIREIWMEHDGVAYILFCSNPADSTTGLVIPVAQQCYDLVDGFAFK